MSTGHLRGERKTVRDLYEMLGEGDTPRLYAKPVELDTSHDIPYAGGISVDGRTVHIDHTLYAEVMNGAVRVRGMTPKQLVRAWIEHEHTEKSLSDGDNPVDVYQAAHGFATAKEEEFVRLLGRDPAAYEEAIRPALERCLARDPRNPPRDLWCGPYLDEPDARDLVILRIFRAKGVVDAHKVSKISVRYGIGGDECRKCRHFGGGLIAPCEIVCGLVRANRQCDKFAEK
jgi:hypothetical protein